MDELDLSEIETRWNKAFTLIQMGCFSKGCSVGYGFIINDELASEYAPASQEFIDNAPMDISALVLEVKRLRQDRAEVRREGYEAGVNDERLTHVPGWDDWMKGHAKGYVEALLEAAGIVDQYEKEWVGKSHGSMRECAANIAARLRYKARNGNWFPDQGQSQETKIIDAKTEIENIAKIQPSQPPTETDPIASFGRFLFYSPKKKGQNQDKE